MNFQQMLSQSDAGKSAPVLKTANALAKQGDGQFLKRGTCVNM